MPEFKLYYFELYARAEPIRMMLHKGGADWEDVIKKGDDWKAFKPTIPGGQMPILELADGTMLGQSKAIAKLIGRKYGFYPEDPMLAYKSDAVCDYLEDRVMEFVGPAFCAPEDKEAKMKVVFEEAFPKLMKNLDSFIPEAGWITGDKMCVADFQLGNLYGSLMTNPKGRYGIEDGKWKEALEQYPKFNAYGQRFNAEFKDWIEKRFEATL